MSKNVDAPIADIKIGPRIPRDGGNLQALLARYQCAELLHWAGGGRAFKPALGKSQVTRDGNATIAFATLCVAPQRTFA
jgi:hypothetical protein